jgi:hypothetical protein
MPVKMEEPRLVILFCGVDAVFSLLLCWGHWGFPFSPALLLNEIPRSLHWDKTPLWSVPQVHHKSVSSPSSASCWSYPSCLSLPSTITSQTSAVITWSTKCMDSSQEWFSANICRIQGWPGVMFLANRVQKHCSKQLFLQGVQAGVAESPARLLSE